MISDFVKGKKQYEYPDDIQKGIRLHRLIDNFTDSHEAVHEAKEFFRPSYRLYSGAIVDVVFDHFLACDETEFSDPMLLEFTNMVYSVLEQQQEWFPERFRNMFPHMKAHNWLFDYRTNEGTLRSLSGLVNRSRYLTEANTAYRIFEDHYQTLKDCYRNFWSYMKPFARNRFDEFMEEGLQGFL